MKKLKRKLFYILVLIFIITFPITSFAHSGRTDSRGGHHDYKNRSGLGSYHYHHGMGPHLHPGGVCPYGGSSSRKSYTPPSPSIKLTKYPETLQVGDSAGFEYSVSNATSGSTSVTSSDTSVVKIYHDNTLRAVGAGTAEITIKDSGATKTFTVKVVAVPVESIEISNPIEQIQLGEDYKFEDIISPKNATNKEVTWLSDNTDVLEIDEIGNITTKSIGVVTITVLSNNNIEDKVTVEIFEVIPDSIECNDSIEIIVGEKKNFKINILPDNANNKNFDVYCDNENILKYSESSIQAVSEGETILHIETWNGITKDIPVKVNIIPVESVCIIDSTKYLMSNIIDKNDDIILDTEILPNDATYQNVEWTSSDNNIVTIKNNHFEIVGVGEVTLTCNAYGNIVNSITFFIIDKYVVFSVACGIIILLIIIIFLIIKQRKSSKKQAIYHVDLNYKDQSAPVQNDETDIVPQKYYISQDKTADDELQKKINIINNVKRDLLKIKNKMLEEAKCGHYKIVNNKKCITVLYPCMFLQQCVSNNDITDNTSNEDPVTYFIGNKKEYDLYLYVIKKCASKNGLKIYPFVIMINGSNHKEIIKLPFTCDNNTGQYTIKVYLKCTVQY